MRYTLFALLMFTFAVPASAQKVRYAIIAHGGAGAYKDKGERGEVMVRVMTDAIKSGQKMLEEGKQGLDVVEHVIKQLEDAPVFNAGRGAVMNYNGDFELDASIMDGRDLNAGAVAGVSRIKNPISLARKVMTDTRHVLLAGKGAELLAGEVKMELIDPEYFRTDHQQARWKKARAEADSKNKQTSTKKAPVYLGTVGCVVLDTDGNLAAGTSTGGLMMKRIGRVGDSPCIGAGTYADNRGAGVSCTGTGELFIRHAIAYEVSSAVRFGRATAAEAAGELLHKTLDKDTGGIIAIDHDGNIVADFNTGGMMRGMANSAGLFEVSMGPKEKE